MKRKLLTTNLLVTRETFFILIRPKEKIMLANIEKIIDKERESAEVRILSFLILLVILTLLNTATAEVVTRRCSVKKVFLNFSQNSAKNFCVGASFNNVASPV